MNNDTPHRTFPWLAVFFGLLAVISFYRIEARNGGIRPVYMGYSSVSNSSALIPPSAGMMERVDAPQAPMPSMAPAMREESMNADMMKVSGQAQYGAPYPYRGGTPDITDTREFNKMYYSSTMRTRDVPGVVRLAETTVRGNGGRIDQIDSSTKSGYLSFVLPQTKFEAFKKDIEALIDWRFLTVSVRAENLLSQKQGIEEQQKYTEMNLDQLTAARKTAVAQHATKKSATQAQIDANEREIAMLKSQEAGATPAVLSQLANRQMELYAQQANLKSQMKTEESSHLSTINSIDAQIKYTNSNLDAVKQQDKDLLDNVATVSGTISIKWMSLEEMVETYLPGHTVPGIFALLAVIAFWWHRKQEQRVE